MGRGDPPAGRPDLDTTGTRSSARRYERVIYGLRSGRLIFGRRNIQLSVWLSIVALNVALAAGLISGGLGTILRPALSRR
jgi:hypothetical protein